MMQLWSEKKEGLLSLAVLLALVLVLIGLLLPPTLYHAERYRAELRKDARILQELRAIEAAQAEISDAQASFEERGLLEWVYSGLSADEVKLDVQRRVSDWLTGTRVQRITPVTTRTAGAYVGVGVQAQFTSTIDELLDVIRQIEEARPLLVIERMRITPLVQRRARNQPEPPQRVTVQVTVLTFIDGEDGL